jgi:hypothetical protein
MTAEPVLPEGGEWAAAPLLYKANIGRYVLITEYVYRPGVLAQIVKIGRVNITVRDRSRYTVMRVNPDGQTATYGDWCAHTYRSYTERSERLALHSWIVSTFRSGATTLTTRTLRAIVDLIDQDPGLS